MNKYEKLIELSNIPGVELFFNTKWLFKKTLGNNLKSADLIVRLLAIDNYFDKNNYGFKLYNTMQKTRLKNNLQIPNRAKDYETEFKNLIKSFKDKGYINGSPVELNKNFEVFDGAHRLVCAMAFNIEKIPVKFTSKYIDKEYDYSIDWFKSNGLIEFEQYILKKYDELIKEKKLGD